MQQRQLRLGDILDDYCPRERRVTNHAVVAMIDADVKQTRCTTCDTEHDYKHAKVPRQRRKANTPPALYAQVLAGGPKLVVPESPAAVDLSDEAMPESDPAVEPPPLAAAESETPEVVAESGDDQDEVERSDDGEDGPVHRPSFGPRSRDRKASRHLRDRARISRFGSQADGRIDSVRASSRGASHSKATDPVAGAWAGRHAGACRGRTMAGHR